MYNLVLIFQMKTLTKFCNIAEIRGPTQSSGWWPPAVALENVGLPLHKWHSRGLNAGEDRGIILLLALVPLQRDQVHHLHCDEDLTGASPQPSGS